MLATILSALAAFLYTCSLKVSFPSNHNPKYFRAIWALSPPPLGIRKEGQNRQWHVNNTTSIFMVAGLSLAELVQWVIAFKGDIYHPLKQVNIIHQCDHQGYHSHIRWCLPMVGLSSSGCYRRQYSKAETLGLPLWDTICHLLPYHAQCCLSKYHPVLEVIPDVAGKVYWHLCILWHLHYPSLTAASFLIADAASFFSFHGATTSKPILVDAQGLLFPLSYTSMSCSKVFPTISNMQSGRFEGGSSTGLRVFAVVPAG